MLLHRCDEAVTAASHVLNILTCGIRLAQDLAKQCDMDSDGAFLYDRAGPDPAEQFAGTQYFARVARQLQQKAHGARTDADRYTVLAQVVTHAIEMKGTERDDVAA